MATNHNALSAPDLQHHRAVLAGARYLLGRLSAAPDGDLQHTLRTAAARSAAALA